MRYAKPMPTNK